MNENERLSGLVPTRANDVESECCSKELSSRLAKTDRCVGESAWSSVEYTCAGVRWRCWHSNERNDLGLGMKRTLFLILIVFAQVVQLSHSEEMPPACSAPPELRAKSGTESFAALTSQGAWFARKHLWHCADEAFYRAAQLSPNSWKALYDLGAIQVNERAYTAAISHLRKASELNPNSDLVRRALAEATRASGDLQGAESLYRRLVELNPRSVEALNDLADVLVAEKLYSAAIRYWDQALALEPDNVDIVISRAEALNTNGDAQEAIESLQQLEGRHVNAAGIHYSLGTMFRSEKRR